MQQNATATVEDNKSSVLDINIADIKVGDRKRDLVEARAEVIKDSILVLGLLQPIILTPEFDLLAGLHRLEACKRLGWETIPATIKNYNSVLAEIAEIDENLCRSELSSMERSIQITRRKELYAIEFPESAKKGRPPVETNGNSPSRKSFVKDTADKTGKSESFVYKEANVGKQLLEKLTPEVRDLIKPTKTADNQYQLQRLMEEPDADVRLEVAKKLNQEFLDGAEKSSVVDALNEIKKTTTYESTVGGQKGEVTLLTALRKNQKLLDASIQSTEFADTAMTWTVEGVEDIREELFLIKDIAERGVDILTTVLEKKEKLGHK